MNKQQILDRAYKFYPVILLIVMTVLAIAVIVHVTHKPTPKEYYVNNAAYEQQKDDCLSGRIKCTPLAPTAN